MSRVLRQLARRADATVFCVASSRSNDDVRLLRLVEGVRFTTAPRAANLLLIAGDIDPGLIAPALVAHDALARPRATVWWRLGSTSTLVPNNFPRSVVVDDPDPVPALRRIHEEIVSGHRGGDAPLLPDVEPYQWRGIGPYRQGGKGMTGGVPYGRPMAERADNRDGLKLDQLPVRIGPLFTPFPIGLALDVKLQGDVIQQAIVESFADQSPHGRSIFHEALRRPVPVRDLELARARSHLYWLSDAVATSGAASLSERILRLAQRVAPGDGDAIRALDRTLRRRGFFGWTTRGVGILSREAVEGVGGPVARASGVPFDARTEENAYRRHGFDPLVQHAGDAAARWRQRVAEAAQALDIAEPAGDAWTGGTATIESPRGPLTDRGGPSPALARLVPPLVAGMEWGDAVATIVSLDLDACELEVAGNRASAAS